MSATDKGCLYLCATPIGNLEDITLRALRILKEADYIAAEDTRHTLKLLNHYEISKPLISYHEHNKSKGTGNHFPGAGSCRWWLWFLTQECPESPTGQIWYPWPMRPASGLQLFPDRLLPCPPWSSPHFPPNALFFEGFLPRTKARLERLRLLQRESRTIILYEAPHRLSSLLKDMLDVLGDRRIAIIRG